MQTLLDHVETTIRDRKLLRRGVRVLVAVSGGVDSMVLLHLLHALAPRRAWQLVVAHFNHQLRGRASTADERFVVRTAARLGLKCFVERADVKTVARARKQSVEMAARELRHEFLARIGRARRCGVIALAHHADDQVELFFLRLLRGAGGEGLAGMKWRTPSPADRHVKLVRPLLDVSKAQLTAFAREHKLPFREDATNASPDILRNRIRHELLPLLRRKYQPALDKAVLRVMDLTGAEADVLGELAEAWLEGGTVLPACSGMGEKSGEANKEESVLSIRRRNRSSRLQTSAASDLLLADVSVGLQRRIVQRQLHRLGIAAGFDLIEALRLRPGVLVSVRPGAGVSCDAAGRVGVQRSRPESFSEGECVVKPAGGTGEVRFAGRRIRWRLVVVGAAKLPAPLPRREMFDADQVGRTVRLRHWRPGDRFQPIGMAHPVKLQDWFVNQKIPRARRRELLVAEAESGQIFWVEGQRISEQFKLTRKTKRRLVWCWLTAKKL